MDSFFKVGDLTEEEHKKILKNIEKRIAEKKKSGVLKEKDIREIEEMRLRPLPDLLDVQSVYEDLMFKTKF
ncbi:MAG: hypothetical protein JXB26_19645 [Candidatus Aminicenantes bacterium]|nr:hypothetical protein [Candidatus Aminicenantes bacterium]